MSALEVRLRRVQLALTRPYAVSGGSWDSADMVFVELRDEAGARGWGQASPAEEVTGENAAASEAALRRLPRVCGGEADVERALDALDSTPAARAALDMALCDLRARRGGVALVEQLGRVAAAQPTSITIGLKGLAETLEEAREYVARGFRALKVKTGAEVELDLERLAKLRETFGDALTLRADANCGYDERAFRRFAACVAPLEIELLEQPTPRGSEACWRAAGEQVRQRIVADESVHDLAELERWIAGGAPFGSVNIKLMKCGGVRPALALARACERAGLGVMWGCMDESVLGISAALHAAFSSRATRYLDLDGSLDLAEDPFTGGFALESGALDVLPAPGLGAQPRTEFFA
jgi:L-alanine-DL-glutamate epimerase-like enolase superfamily enzyme